jgi:hypothetical protein
MRALGFLATAVLASLALGGGVPYMSTGDGTTTQLPSTATLVGSVTTTPPTDFRSTIWNSVVLPGSVCEAPGEIRLHSGQASVPSSRLVSGTGHVYASLATVAYGTLSRNMPEVAAVNVWCTNGAGTADGELADSWVVFAAVPSPKVIGLITPQQPSDVLATHVPYFFASPGGIEFSPGRIVVRELWYGPGGDATCCPSGRATSTWSYLNGKIVHLGTVVTKQPNPIPFLGASSTEPIPNNAIALAWVTGVSQTYDFVQVYVSCGRYGQGKPLPEAFWRVDLKGATFVLRSDGADNVEGPPRSVSRSTWGAFVRTHGWFGYLYLDRVPPLVTNGPATFSCKSISP